MTIRDVPTSTPIPIVEIMRSLDCDKGNERGNEPARKDLIQLADENFKCARHHSRDSHYSAQSEQHQKSVKHVERAVWSGAPVFLNKLPKCVPWDGMSRAGNSLEPTHDKSN